VIPLVRSIAEDYLKPTAALRDLALGKVCSSAEAAS